MTWKLGLEILSDVLDQPPVLPHTGDDVLIVVTNITRVLIERWSTDRYEVANKYLLLVFIPTHQGNVLA